MSGTQHTIASTEGAARNVPPCQDVSAWRDPTFDDWRDPCNKREWLRDWFAPRPEKPDEDDLPADRSVISRSLPPTMSPALASIVLEEARAIYAHRDERLNRIESRATTLQASVGIATVLLIAASALILDPVKVDVLGGV